MHQQPPKIPLCRSTNAAKASHVSGVSGLIVRSSTMAACYSAPRAESMSSLGVKLGPWRLWRLHANLGHRGAIVGA